MTPRERFVAERVAARGALTDMHRAAIKAIGRDAALSAVDITRLEIAARMAQGLPVTDDAAREVGYQYLELIVELGKQVDARMSAEADRIEVQVAMGKQADAVRAFFGAQSAVLSASDDVKRIAAVKALGTAAEAMRKLVTP